MEIQVASGVQERFENALDKEFPVAGWLVGWHTGSGIVCLGCVACSGSAALDLIQNLERAVELVPAGLEVVGVFVLGKEAMNHRGVADYFEQLLMSGLKAVQILNETSEFCLLTQGEDDESCSGYLYNSSLNSASLVNVKCEDSSVLWNDIVLFRVQGNLPLSYELTNEKAFGDEELLNSVEELTEVVESRVAAFHLANSSVLLLNRPDFHSTVPGLRDDTVCFDLTDFLITEDDGFGSTRGKKRKGYQAIEPEVLKIKLLFQATGDDAIKRTISCLPIVHCEHREFQNVTVNIPVDIIAMVPKSSPVGKMHQLFVNGIARQLVSIKRCMSNHVKNGVLPSVQIFHFKPPDCDHFVSLVYPKNVCETELESTRRKLHQWLLLPDDRPLLRRINCYLFADEQPADAYLKNTHVGLAPSGVEHGKVSLVHGTYSYHHYMQDHFDDNGWGCAYRSLQTIVSWFRHQGYTSRPIPTHSEIQQALVEVGDKPASFVGSRKWIGSLEVSYCLQQLIGVTSKIMNVSSGTELGNKGRELANHFKKQGTPIMIGGGVLAHTIIGVDFNEKTGDLKFLILDPHFTGAEDLNIIQNKGWCGWKGLDFWDANAYYNLCLPQRPLDI